MNQIVTRGIVLTRIDFQEADRILTMLTPDQGKISVLAKGVRRSKSKLAGGIELFSVSDITYIPGRGELGTLISTRLITHYGNIVTDIERTMLGYDFIKLVHKITEVPAGEEYFDLLHGSLVVLNDLGVSKDLVELWFTMQLLKITGHAPNLQTDASGAKLSGDQHYFFDSDTMAFAMRSDGPYIPNTIKLLRLAIATDNPLLFSNVRADKKIIAQANQLTKTVAQSVFSF